MKSLASLVTSFRIKKNTYFEVGFPGNSTVKNLPAMQETQVWSLGQEDPLEKGMTTHSSILAWRIPWTEDPGGLQSVGSQRVGHDWTTNTFTFNVLTVWHSSYSAYWTHLQYLPGSHGVLNSWSYIIWEYISV